MKVVQKSPGVFDLEAETPAEQDFVCWLYNDMADARRVPREFMKKQRENPETPTPWRVIGVRFDVRPASQLKRNPVCKAISFLAEKSRLFWRELASDC